MDENLAADADVPTVSVIIPVRNEREHIEQCLRSILDQDYPSEKLEIVLVDGLSEDDTREMARRMLESNDSFEWRILTNPDQATPAGLNQGIRDSAGEMIMRLDGHSWIAPDYITKCVETAQRTGAWCVGGAARPLGTGFIGEAIALAHLTRFGLGTAKFRNPSAHGEADTLWPGFWPRWVFDQIGLFNEGLSRNQDIELSSRIRQHGGALYIDPSIRIWYRCRHKAELSQWHVEYSYLQAKSGELSSPAFRASCICGLSGLRAGTCAGGVAREVLALFTPRSILSRNGRCCHSAGTKERLALRAASPSSYWRCASILRFRFTLRSANSSLVVASIT